MNDIFRLYPRVVDWRSSDWINLPPFVLDLEVIVFSSVCAFSRKNKTTSPFLPFFLRVEMEVVKMELVRRCEACVVRM